MLFLFGFVTEMLLTLTTLEIWRMALVQQGTKCWRKTLFLHKNDVQSVANE